MLLTVLHKTRTVLYTGNGTNRTGRHRSAGFAGFTGFAGFAASAVVATGVLLATLVTASCATAPAPAPKQQVAEETLMDLISAGKMSEVKQRFSNSDQINQKNAQGQSLLHIAALKNDAEMVQFLISLGADQDIRDKSGDTPLSASIAADCFASVKVLADAGSNIFARNSVGVTVAELARRKGADGLNAIITPKTVLQQDGDGRTLLHQAADRLDPAATEKILASGGDTSVLDAAGDTALAIVYKKPTESASASIAAALLLAGAEPLRGDFTYFETSVLKRNPGMRFEEGRTPLHIASEKGHSGYVSYLLSKNVPVNVKDVASSTPIHEAVRNGMIDCTELLLKAGADPDPKDASGNTPLHLVMPLATRSAIFAKLLAAGADPNQKDNYGETPLHIAARLGMSDDIIEALISSGGDTNERNKRGVTPLSLAIERKQLAQANLFVRLGADIHAEDIDGNTALSKAISSGIEMIQSVILPSNVQTRDSQGRTPLHIAVMGKADPEVLNYLISIKADVNARDKNGDSPIHIAVRNNDRASGEILLAYGADVFTPNVSGESALKDALTRMGGRQDWVLNSNVIKSADGAGNTPLHLAAEWQLTQVVAFIVEKGGDINARNANGETPLFNAVKADSGETIRAMISGSAEKKADINARDFLGNSTLHACIRWAASRAAEVLLATDSATNSRRLINARNLAGKTALHEAARTGNIPFVKSLVLSKADINAADETGKTPLTDAIQANQTDVVKILLDNGASPVMQDMYGRNAYHEAVEKSTPEIAILIRNAGGNPMARDTFGRTPLSLAFRKSAEAVLAVIGTNTNIVDSDGNTPLHIAVTEHSNENIFQDLIKAGFPVNNRNRTGTTALLQSIREGQEGPVRILLTSGADPYATDNMGENPVIVALTKKTEFLPLLAEYAGDTSDTIGDGLLHYAARMGDAESVKKLLMYPKVDRTDRNIAGETAYDIAMRWGRKEIAALLK